MGRILATLLLLTTLSLPAMAKDTSVRQVVVEWRDGWVEVFVNVPTTDLIDGGIAHRAGLIENDNKIAFTDLRTDPSYILEDVLAELGMATAGQEFAPMSMMAHGQFENLAFNTPFDAAMASAVCGVPLDVELLPPERTQVYLGAIKDISDTTTQMDLNLTAFEGPMLMTVFDNGEPVSSGFVETNKGPVTVERGGAVAISGVVSAALLLALMGAGVLVVLAGLRLRPAKQEA